MTPISGNGAALAPTKPTTATLYELEESLVALLDSEELVAGTEQEAEFRSDLAIALKATATKRDRCAQFLAHCEEMENAADAEIERLRTRKAMFHSARERMRRYICQVIESLGTDANGKYRKLEGRTATFSVRACPASVEVEDAAKVPAEYKRASVCLPATVLAHVAELVNQAAADRNLLVTFNAAVDAASVDVDKRKVKAVIENGGDVPGVDVKTGGLSLVVR